MYFLTLFHSYVNYDNSKCEKDSTHVRFIEHSCVQKVMRNVILHEQIFILYIALMRGSDLPSMSRAVTRHDQ